MGCLVGVSKFDAFLCVNHLGWTHNVHGNNLHQGLTSLQLGPWPVWELLGVPGNFALKGHMRRVFPSGITFQGLRMVF